MISAVRSTVYNYVYRSPIDWVDDKIVRLAQNFFGFLSRVTTFQLGVIQDWKARIIMRIYSYICDRNDGVVVRERLNSSMKLLRECGGIESVVHPIDGGAQIQCMTFKSSEFLSRIGAFDLIYNGEQRKAITNLEIAKKFYFPIVDIEPYGKVGLLPEAAKIEGSPPMILHSHSPGRSMGMDRKFIGLHLAAGYDVAVWDPRGTVDSTGTPSEGGYYLDVDAVFQHVRQLGYEPNRIYASGFCKGAACAVYLKKKYHHLGVHLIISNPYTSLTDVFMKNKWLGQMGAKYGIKAIQDPSLSVEQDCFDNVAKLSNLPHSEGRFILIDTDTDKMMPEDTVKIMMQAIGNAGPISPIRRIHPDPSVNGHMQPPYEDPKVWRQYITVVT